VGLENASLIDIGVLTSLQMLYNIMGIICMF